MSYIHLNQNTVHTTELIGGADIETEFQVKTNDEYYLQIKKLKNKFKNAIKSYETMQYTKEYKFTYLPDVY